MPIFLRNPRWNSGWVEKMDVLKLAYWNNQITHIEYRDAMNDLVIHGRVIGGVH